MYMSLDLLLKGESSMKKYKYVPSTPHNESILQEYPNAGPYPNITGMRKLYWGADALVIRCGAYAYNVPYEVFVRF